MEQEDIHTMPTQKDKSVFYQFRNTQQFIFYYQNENNKTVI